jgi:hypothetical protein
MPRFRRHFSVEEARALLPELRTRFAAMRELVSRINDEQRQNHQEGLRIMSGNGKGPLLKGVSPLVAEVQHTIDEIVAMGVQIKNLEDGLIDFPHFLADDENREVLLCYKMSEPGIAFWHEIEDGFAGRRPL